ncbi:hypothetical protein D3C76_1790240 [compost metagenome]
MKVRLCKNVCLAGELDLRLRQLFAGDFVCAVLSRAQFLQPAFVDIETDDRPVFTERYCYWKANIAQPNH